MKANTVRDWQSSKAEPATDELSRSSFWHWFAVGVLVVCWIAEGTMCAGRGF
jgi:hypothetical protein